MDAAVVSMRKLFMGISFAAMVHVAEIELGKR
jgi:hypothetical protein